MTGAELADTARLRQGLYRFCAGALLPPDQGRVAALRAAATLIDADEVEAFAFGPAWRAVRTEVARLPDIAALAAEHVRLFQATSGGALCPPVESFYLGEARQAAVATTAVDLEAIYRRHGLRFTAGQAHLPDEAAPQLELMAYLCGSEASARERGDAAAAALAVGAQAAFLEGHLARWFPRFADRVRSVGCSAFYRAVVEAGAAFIGHDRELAALLGREAVPS